MTNWDRWNLFMRDIESPDIYLEWGFYHLISSALQRRVWMYPSPGDLMPESYSLFPNLYITLIGPPSTGKGRVIVQEAAIIKAPGLERPGPTGEKLSLIPYSPDKLTVEAMTRHIALSVKSCVREHPTDPKKKQAYAYCPCSFLIDELEVLFAERANDMVSVLQKLWDSGDCHYKTKQNGEDKIKNVCVSMITGTTPDSIRDLVSKKLMGKGMTSRMVFIYAAAPRFYREFGGIDTAQQKARDELIEHVKKLTTLFTHVEWSPEAAAYHKEFYESGKMADGRTNKDPILDHYYGRKNTHWKKLMMVELYAEQTTSNVITLDIVKKTYDRLTNAEIAMHRAFETSGANPIYDSILQVERFLQENGKTSHRRLWWVFSKNVNKQQFDEIIDLLVTTRRIENVGGFYQSNVADADITSKVVNNAATRTITVTTNEQLQNGVPTGNGAEEGTVGGKHVGV